MIDPKTNKTSKPSGFTIVELLIVVVVIGILAAIVTVAYTGIQQRANNVAIIDTASKTLKAIQAYLAVNSSYPITTYANACVTTVSGCDNLGSPVSAYATFDTNIATIATLSRSIPGIDGLYVSWHTSHNYNGEPQPLRLTYFLFGNNQQCGLSRVMAYTWPTDAPSATGYTANIGDKTRCWISVPGPTS